MKITKDITFYIKLIGQCALEEKKKKQVSQNLPHPCIPIHSTKIIITIKIEAGRVATLIF